MKPAELDTLNDRTYLWRLLVFVLLGACAALALTWFMHQLIHSSQQRLDDSSRAHLVEFVRLQRDETSERRERRPERLVSEQAPPAPIAPPADASQAEATLAVSETQLPVGLDGSVRIGGMNFDASEGEYLPIVKIAPVYPHRAAVAGLEGECVVVYTVTTTGATRDVRIVESMCTDRVFHSASVAAAKKFKYKPRVIDGQAMEVHDVTNRFIYEVPDDARR